MITVTSRFIAWIEIKKAEGFDIDQFIIERVPTFIFYKNESEIGRIIETPVETLEKDILNILKNVQEP